MMEVSVKSSAYTFGTLLALYLFGSGVGAMAGIALAPRIGAPRRAFLACQCLLLLYACAAIALLVWTPPTIQGYSWLYDLWGGRRSFNLGGKMYLGALLRLYVVFPLALFGIPTVLMGLSYPDPPARGAGRSRHQRLEGRRAASRQHRRLRGRQPARGALDADLAGDDGHLPAAGGRRARLRRPRPARARGPAALPVAGRAAWRWPPSSCPRSADSGCGSTGRRSRPACSRRTRPGVVALVPDRKVWQVWAGGRWHSTLPFSGIHTTLGAAPAVIHPSPREVAIIGLGSGDTAASAGCRRDVDQRVTVFELYAPEQRLLGLLAARGDAPAKLVQLLDDPRYSFPIADGRNAIDRGGRLYDLIEADALWPTAPYAGNLYSLEFFQMCAGRLRPGGLVTTWLPSPRVRATFLSVFPHAVEISGQARDRQPLPHPHRPRRLERAALRSPGTPRTSDGNSRLDMARQQKYWDQGRSTALLTRTWPICCARSSCGAGGKPSNASILPSRQEPDGLLRRIDGPGDVLLGTQADLGRDAGEEDVFGAPERRHPRRLALQVGDPSHPLRGDDLEAPHVHAGEEHHGIPLDPGG